MLRGPSWLLGSWEVQLCLEEGKQTGYAGSIDPFLGQHGFPIRGLAYGDGS